MPPTTHIDVLGGGPAGLGVGFYARRASIPFSIWEASERIGGNATTLRHGEFLFDTGAHRFHDKDAAITADVRELLGASLRRVHAPSRIFSEGRWFDFPLSPLDLLRNLGALGTVEAGASFVRARARTSRSNGRSFQDFAIETYGETIARRFLLSYSEKLWGVPCEALSPDVAGARLKGLNLRTFLKEATLGARAKVEHLDGAFYYPNGGYGEIASALAKGCGGESVKLASPVTALGHDGSRITSLSIRGDARPANEVVSSLAPGVLVRLMEPAPPSDIVKHARALRHRSVVLVAVFLDRPSVTDAATVYLPDPGVRFTRVSEPRNRWSGMSPPGKTSLVAEVPCQKDDATWRAPDDELTRDVLSTMVDLGWMRATEVIGSAVVRLPSAYPVLEVGFREALDPVLEWLSRFENLRLSGRSGLFAYTHVHDQLRSGKNIVAALASKAGRG